MVNWMKSFRWESVLAALSVNPNSIDPNVSPLSGVCISIQRHHTARDWVISLNRSALRQFVVYPAWVKSAGYVPYGYSGSTCSVYCAAVSGFVDSQFTYNRFLSGSDFWHDSGDIAGCDDQLSAQEHMVWRSGHAGQCQHWHIQGIHHYRYSFNVHQLNLAFGLLPFRSHDHVAV